MMAKRHIWTILFLLSCLVTDAQEYFNLTAQQVRIDSLLPNFTYSWPLDAHYADSVYTVTIAYPEFIPMSADDVKRYEQIEQGVVPSSLPEITQQISISRKKASLGISFVPIVFRDGTYQKLVSFQLKRQALPLTGANRTFRASAEQSRVANTSLLASGKWAKIRVPSSGIYQLTDALVRQAGFSNINKVHIYGYGGAMQPEKLDSNYIASTDDLKEVPTCTVNGQRLFWAQGPVSWNGTERIRNPYSQYGYYFLTESDEEPLTQSEQELLKNLVSTGELSNTLYEVDDYAWYHGGRNLYDARTFTVGQARDYTLPASATGTGTLTVVLTAFDASNRSQATISVNGTSVGTMTVERSSNYNHATQEKKSFDVTNLTTSNTIRIQQTNGGTMRLDYIALHADSTTLAPSLQEVKVGTPELVGTVANQNLHGDSAIDMVIIIPESRKLLTQAERLKAFHEQHDTLRVRIVAADELYNEFSSGTPDANAYRRYLRMLYERAGTAEADMPKYLLLFGDGAWDNRMLSSDWKNCKPEDFLLCFESENSFSATECYVTDDYFCLLDNGEGGNLLSSDCPDVAVGRFPVRSESDAKTMVDKVISYAENRYAGSWQNEICVMGDDGNNNLHMTDANAVAQLVEQQYPEYVVKRIMWDAYERVSSATGNTYPDVTRLIKQQMQNGALIMNYSGHGAAYSFSHEQVVQLNDFSETVSNHLPFWMTASCDIMPFDGQEENIGETTILNKKGGGIAFYGTTRTVYSTYNRVMNLALMDKILRGIPIGEAVRQAKGSLITTRLDTSTNKLHYVLLGDPALRLVYPALRAVVDDINGASVSEGDPLVLRAGTTVTVRGHMECNGVRQTAYNGTMTATVRDAEEVITCRLNDTSGDGAEEAFVYKDRTKVIFHGTDSIQSGQFAFRFTVPQDISYSEDTGLINLYAVDNSRQAIGNGVCNHLVLGGSTAEQRDTIGPKVYCYLNSENFTNGDKVNLTPYFVAHISDDNGINATGNGIGHDIQLIIDGQTALTYTLNDYFSYDFGSYTSGTVGFSIPTLTAGRHKLQFRVWDTQNNSTTTELSFVVVESLEPIFFDVESTHNPATTNTSFRIIHDRTGSQMDVILDVFDMSGRHLWQHAESGIPTDDTYFIDWDLTSGSGSRISTGVYLYRVRISSDGSSYASRAKKLIVISNK